MNEKILQWIYIIILFIFIIYVSYKIIVYQKNVQEKKLMVFEIENFINEVDTINHKNRRYKLTDDDIFELYTHNQRHKLY